MERAIKKKKWFSFLFFHFDSLITLIEFRCIANRAILTHFKDGKKINNESLSISFRFRYKFQQSFFTKQGEFVRGARLSTTQIYKHTR